LINIDKTVLHLARNLSIVRPLLHHILLKYSHRSKDINQQLYKLLISRPIKLLKVQLC